MSDWGRIPAASIQRLILFECPSYYYLIGGNKTRTQYRILQVDRSCQDELKLVEDPVVYSYDACMLRIRQLEVLHSPEGGLVRKSRYAALLGFVKFFSSYYIVLVENASVVGTIAGHHIYTLNESPTLIQVNLTLSNPRYSSDEARYRTLFCAMDMTRDFFFSYSLDITNTIQHHLTLAPMRPTGKITPGQPAYNDMFLWNFYLMQPMSMALGFAGAKWIVPLIHGFFAQSCLKIGEQLVRVSLVSRRSRHFAGTRYIKRGMDSDGHVANEVETEQILQVQSAWVQGQGRFSSCVVMRGSIPLFWSQENPMAPAPAVIIDRTDPATQHATTKAHLLDVFSRYGPAVFMLNLIRLNQAQETPLGLEFSKCVGMMRHALNAEASSWWNIEGKLVCHNILRLMDEDEKKILRHQTNRASQLSSFKQCDSCLSGIDPEFACRCETPSSWARVGSLAGTPTMTIPLGRKRSTVVRVPQLKTGKPLAAENMGSVLDYCYRCTGLPPWSMSTLVSSLMPKASESECARHIQHIGHHGVSPTVDGEVKLGPDCAETDEQSSNLISGDLFGSDTSPLLPSSVLYKLHYVAYDFLQQMKETGLVVEEISKIIQPMLKCTSHFIFVPPTGKGDALDAIACSGSVRRIQRGVVRVNCVDCLDRTNVAQYCVIKTSMRDQLFDLGFNDERLEIEAFPELVETLQNMFYEQGDRIANQYGGSGAMHKEALATATAAGTAVAAATASEGGATAKRSGGGGSFVSNAMTSIKRYYNNNFSDHGKQHAINVFLGNFMPDPSKPNIWEIDASTVRSDADNLFGICVGSVSRALSLAQSQQLQILSRFISSPVVDRCIKEVSDESQATLTTVSEPSAYMSHSVSRQRIHSEFDQFFEERYSPSDMTSFDEELAHRHNHPVAVRKVIVAEVGKKFSLSLGGGSLTSVPEDRVGLNSYSVFGASVEAGCTKLSREALDALRSSAHLDIDIPPEPLLTSASVYAGYAASASNCNSLLSFPLPSSAAVYVSLLTPFDRAHTVSEGGASGATTQHDHSDVLRRAQSNDAALIRYVSASERILAGGVSTMSSGNGPGEQDVYLSAHEPESENQSSESRFSSQPTASTAAEVNLNALDQYWREVELVRDATHARLKLLNELISHRSEVIATAAASTSRPQKFTACQPPQTHQRKVSLMNHIREEYAASAVTSFSSLKSAASATASTAVVSAVAVKGTPQSDPLGDVASPICFPRHRLSLSGPSPMPSSTPSLASSSLHDDKSAGGFFTSLASLFGKK